MMARLLAACLLLLTAVAAPGAWAVHAYAQFGDIKYPAGFPNFEWVNVDAPKGGDIDLVPPLRITNFDKYNPFTLKGIAAPGLSALVFEALSPARWTSRRRPTVFSPRTYRLRPTSSR